MDRRATSAPPICCVLSSFSLQLASNSLMYFVLSKSNVVCIRHDQYYPAIAGSTRKAIGARGMA
jgi:hypothetical protein